MTNMIRVKSKNTEQYNLIDLSNVLFIQFFSEFSKVVTENTEYLWPVTLEGLKDLVHTKNFTNSDRTLFVNVDKVVKIHSAMNYIVFEDVPSIKRAREQGVRMAYLNNKHVAKFKKIVGLENDLAYTIEEGSKGVRFKRIYDDELFN